MSIYRGSDLIIPKWKGTVVDRVYLGSNLIYTKSTPEDIILYPDANSTPSEFTNNSAESTKWEGVQEAIREVTVVAQNISSHSIASFPLDKTDLYTLDDIGTVSNITNVNVSFKYYISIGGSVTALDSDFFAVLKIDGTEYASSADSFTDTTEGLSGPITVSKDWAENPDTATTWTDSDIDALIAGFNWEGTFAGNGLFVDAASFKVTVSHDE